MTRGKSHDRLGQRRAIFEVNGWVDTIADCLGCNRSLFDFTSAWVTWRLNGVRQNLDELDGNIRALRSGGRLWRRL